MQAIIIITGSAGLIGSESVKFYSEKGYKVIGIDNNMRKYFFGDEASTAWNCENLNKQFSEYEHYDIDIRNFDDIADIFKKHENRIECVLHTAAQPSHDWAAKEPLTDFTVNANGTLNLLEATRKYAPKAVFIFTSTNKVYGDTPNDLPLIELDRRWEIADNHRYSAGIDESMSIDQCKHSLFGASKVAADILVQEYGRYFGMNTGVFRGGCLTGAAHSGTELHGFLSYLMRATIEGRKYRILGYKGKQVRDNIHSFDLINMFWHFHQSPKPGSVYNAGGSRHSNCSILEAIELCETVAKKKLDYTYTTENRIGDHIWYISDIAKFNSDYPRWNYKYDLNDIIEQVYDGWIKR